MGPIFHRGEWILAAKRHSTTISPDRSRVYAFDLEGRPLSWFDQGRVYKRSLASTVFGRERSRGARRHWRVSGAAASALFGRTLREVSRVPTGGLPRELEHRLERIRSWPPERLLDEARRFRAAYRPIGILPPDQYLSVVLQATHGCSWNRCTFCSFYAGRPFRARDPEGFRDHAHRVRELLGRSVALRRGVFLADGNALILANRRLAPLLACARELFPGRGLYGFVDVFGGERKSTEEWRELGRMGLRRVYVGVETGDDPLLRWLNKPGSAAAVESFVVDLKRSGLAVSAILMVGVGGTRFAADHERHTLRLVARLPLGRGDIVYLSPLRTGRKSAYARLAAREGIGALDLQEMERQYVRLRDGIRQLHPGIPVGRYDLREFVY